MGRYMRLWKTNNPTKYNNVLHFVLWLEILLDHGPPSVRPLSMDLISDNFHFIRFVRARDGFLFCLLCHRGKEVQLTPTRIATV